MYAQMMHSSKSVSTLATNVSQIKTILYFQREIRYNFQHSVLAKGDFLW